jgi:hypothetical protein
MSRSPPTFRRRDVTAAVEAVVKAGVEIAGVEVAPDGTIKIIVEKPCSNGQGNPWDAAVEELDKR